jgi:hypothetical protein
VKSSGGVCVTAFRCVCPIGFPNSDKAGSQGNAACGPLRCHGVRSEDVSEGMSSTSPAPKVAKAPARPMGIRAAGTVRVVRWQRQNRCNGSRRIVGIERNRGCATRRRLIAVWSLCSRRKSKLNSPGSAVLIRCSPPAGLTALAALAASRPSQPPKIGPVPIRHADTALRMRLRRSP